MLKFLKAAIIATLFATPSVADTKFGLGRLALPEEIKAWDIDVLPDGRGLPEGRGNVLVGEEVFADKCASCHGDFAEGVDNWPVLAGGFDTLADKDPVKTVGSYWPHLSTTWDYVNRSMPFGSAQTLPADEVYALVAYILYSNDLVEEDFELSHENFADFEMYNKDGFVIDDRPQTEYSKWRNEPCMENCKDSVMITMRASVVDVTPEETASASSMNQTHNANQANTDEVKVEVAASAPTEEAAPDVLVELDAGLVKAGKKTFKKCSACHQVGDKAKNRSGPQLNGIIGRTFGSVETYKYSKVFKAANEEGRVWDVENLAEFLKKPKAYMKKTKMGFAGIKKDKDMAAIVEYLKSVSQ